MSEKEYTLNDHLEKWLHEQEAKEQRVKESKRKASQRYKSKKCASLQVFLDVDLVSDFKAVCKERGISQADAIREFIHDFLKR